MRPVLLHWRAYSLYWYSVLVWLGIVLSVSYAQWRSRRAGYRYLQIFDGALWTLLGGLVGARMAYIIPNWNDYVGCPAKLLSFWGGGLVFQGGLIGGLTALWFYSLFTKLSFCHLMDMAAPAVSLAQGVGWVGAWMHGANYGLIKRSPFSLWLPDIYGFYGPRFPTQLLACLLGFSLFFFLHHLSEHSQRPGVLGLFYLLANGLGHFLLEFTRADETSHLGFLRVTQVAELVETVLACFLALYLRFRVEGG